jgi:hypothetical protein
MASTGVGADWYGFNVGPNGEVEFLVPDVVEDRSAIVAAEATIDMLDGFYTTRIVEPVGPRVCVVTKWGLEWMRRALFGDISVEKFSASAIKSFDLEGGEPLEYVETHTYVNEHQVSVPGESDRVVRVERKKQMIKKGKRSNFASCVASLAYNKFGARPMSEANVLVTRRWIQKLLDEPTYKDLRVVDKNIAIDRALFLSFVPTNDFRQMRLVTSSRAWEKRVDPKGLLGGLFGKAFVIIRDEIPDELANLE